MSYILGFDNGEISNIKFKDIDMHYYKENPDNPRFPCNNNDIKNKDAAFFIDDTDNVSLKNVEFYGTKELFKQDIFTDNCSNFKVTD